MSIINNLFIAISNCDTLVVKVAKAADVVCQPIIREAETSDNDVIIAKYICLVVAFVAFVVGATLLSWKWLENRANEKERKFKKEKEDDEYKRKQEADKFDEKLRLEDRERKQRMEDEDRERKQRMDDEDRQREHDIEDTERARRYAREDEEKKENHKE